LLSLTLIHEKVIHRDPVCEGSYSFKSIGFYIDEPDTHKIENPAANIQTQALQKAIQYPAKMKSDFVNEVQFVKWIWCYHKRLSSKEFLLRNS
jgi:hypothetical protein